MITPLFDCSQDNVSVTLRARVPHSRPRDFDIFAEDCDFHLYCRPYLLRLQFPHAVVFEHDSASATYDYDTGIATIRLIKATPGQHFPRLGCLSSLLFARKPSGLDNVKTNPLEPPSASPAHIQVISSSTEPSTPEIKKQSSSEQRYPNSDDLPCISKILQTNVNKVGSSTTSSDGVTEQITSKPASFECTTDSKLRTVAEFDTVSDLRLGHARYGFGGRYHNVFSARAEDTSEITDVPEPDHTPNWKRREMRLADEMRKFNPDHYLADFMLADEFASVFAYKPDDVALRELTVAEKDAMLKLPRREYLPDSDPQAVADLAGLLFASCYDLRITLGERNSESAWTISRISPSLSSLDQMTDPKSAISAAYARSLIYPLYRNIELANAVLEDTRAVFESDIESVRVRLLRILLDIRSVFEESLTLRIFSDIFLTDYCVWIQQTDDSALSQLAKQVRTVAVPVASLPWDLVRLQTYALQVSNGQEPDDDQPEWKWMETNVTDSVNSLSQQLSNCSVIPDPRELIEMKKMSLQHDWTSRMLQAEDKLDLIPVKTRILRVSHGANCLPRDENSSSDNESGTESSSSYSSGGDSTPSEDKSS